MIDITLLGSIALIHTLALASPGPDFAIMLRVATRQPRSVALMAALGIALAILVHTLASLTGLSLIIHTTPWLFVLVQATGAIYLGYMGVGALLSVRKHWAERQSQQLADTPAVDEPSLGNARGLRLGLYTNLFNPKALVFFLTLFSAMVGPEVNTETRLSLLLLMFALSFAWFGLLALLLTKPGVKQTLVRIGPVIDLITGALFLMVSIGILASLVSELLT
ncbi:LysE family transporter [Shewanella sp.]|uniref:LysE family transporter n=1 Tax=Shewanella sp. TaxID=50422 RepID=UPI003564840A